MKKLPLFVLIAAYFFSTQSAFAGSCSVVLSKASGARIVLAQRALTSTETARSQAYRFLYEFADKVTNPGNTVTVYSPSGDALAGMYNNGRDAIVTGL